MYGKDISEEIRKFHIESNIKTLPGTRYIYDRVDIGKNNFKRVAYYFGHSTNSMTYDILIDMPNNEVTNEIRNLYNQ